MNDTDAYYHFFNHHPDPMWIYNTHDLKLIDVNQAAINRYGYSRDEFLGMTTKDLDLCENSPVPSDSENVSPELPGNNPVRSHRDKNGSVIYVSIHHQTFRSDEKCLTLVSARGITAHMEQIKQLESALSREQEATRNALSDANHFRSLFETLPGNFLVLTSDECRIVAVSDAYLNANMTERSKIQGQLLFDVFPSDPAEPASHAITALRESFNGVCSSGETDIMAVQRFPIRRPTRLGGGFEERYWSVTNKPMKGENGEIKYIIYRAEDVTEFVSNKLLDRSKTEAIEDIEDQSPYLQLDTLLLRSQELKTANNRLMEQAVYLRTAERLAGLGVWKLDLSSNHLEWSDNLYEMYGVNSDSFDHSFDAYVDLVHPDDRDAMLTNYRAFIESEQSIFQFEHRIISSDDRVVHVRGTAELTDFLGSQNLTGVVQDITAQVEDEASLNNANDLLRISGMTARLGGWRVDLHSMRLEWSEQTAKIHETPFDPNMSIEKAMEFYAPEHRERISTVFTNCAESGVPFDEILRLVTAKNNLVWVRVIGEAERDQSGNIIATRGAFQDITELMAAQAKARTLDERLHQTLEQISDAIFTLDAQFNFVYVNNRAEQLLDYKSTDLIGKNIWQVFSPAIGTQFQFEYEKAIRENITVRFTEFYPPLNKWLQVNAYPLNDGLAVYFRDVTEELEGQQQLRLLEAAVSRQTDILIITDAEPIAYPGPKIVYVNDAFVRQTGYTREEVLGKSPRILQGPKTQRDQLDRIRSGLEARQAVRAELINYTKSGDEFWMELDIVPLVNAQGELTHWVSVERDVTQRRQAEEAIRISEERFQLIAKATNDVIWDWNASTNSVWWSKDSQELFGDRYTYEESVFGGWLGPLHPDDKTRVLNGMARAIKDKDESNWEDEYRYELADGRSFIVSNKGFVIRNSDGVAERMLGSMADVTQRREIDKRLHQSQKMEAIGQLTGGIAHDFNNLLTVILGNAEMLHDALKHDPQIRPLADITITAAQRGAGLTSRLLAFAGKQALKPQSIVINSLINDMENLIRRTVEESISIRCILDPDLWPTEIDSSQMENALLNLAINARDAMTDGGRLTVTTQNIVLNGDKKQCDDNQLSGPCVKLSVSDSGHGMSEETMARAFEPFFTTKTCGKGSGLGLSMVYGFVKQSGGHIHIESELGLGTTISLFLPRAAEKYTGQKHDTHPIKYTGGHEHILTVEDNPMVRDYVTRQLESLGYRVTVATNGMEALAKLTEIADIDLLFTDIVMPGGISGSELSDIALRSHPHLKVLFTSGYTVNALSHDTELAPETTLLSKPYSRQDLAIKVRAALET